MFTLTLLGTMLTAFSCCRLGSPARVAPRHAGVVLVAAIGGHGPDGSACSTESDAAAIGRERGAPPVANRWCWAAGWRYVDSRLVGVALGRGGDPHAGGPTGSGLGVGAGSPKMGANTPEEVGRAVEGDTGRVGRPRRVELNRWLSAPFAARATRVVPAAVGGKQACGHCGHVVVGHGQRGTVRRPRHGLVPRFSAADDAACVLRCRRHGSHRSRSRTAGTGNRRYRSHPATTREMCHGPARPRDGGSVQPQSDWRGT